MTKTRMLTLQSLPGWSESCGHPELTTEAAKLELATIHERNLIAKTNRRLRPLGQKLLTKRRNLDVGPIYIIDLERNILLWKNIDLQLMLAELSGTRTATVGN